MAVESPVVLPVVEELRFQLEDVPLQHWHMTGLGFQFLHFTQSAEQCLPGFLNLPPHAHLFPLQRTVAVLQCGHSLFRAPQLLLQSLIIQHGFFYLSVSRALQHVYLLDNILQALQVAVGAAHSFLGCLLVVGNKTTVLWFMFGVAFP